MSQTAVGHRSDDTPRHTTYSYDSAGLLNSKNESAESRVTSFTYDYFARANHETQTVGANTVKDFTAAYDSLGRVKTSEDAVRHLTQTLSYPQNTAGNTTDVAGVGQGSDLVTATIRVGADGLEESRASTIADYVPTVTRAIDPVSGRDDAKRLTAATLETNDDSTADIYSQYHYDSAGHLVGQWGIGTWGQLGTEDSGYRNTASQTPCPASSILDTFPPR